MSSTIKRRLTYITVMVFDKIPMLKFFESQDTWPNKKEKKKEVKLSPLNTLQVLKKKKKSA